MRLILLAVLAMPFSLFAQADKKAPAFGKIDRADLEMKTCDFDPDAEALVLSDYGQDLVDFRSGSVYQEFQRHIRIKILKDKGKNWADVKIKYYTYRNDQNLINISAATYNLTDSGTVVTTKLDKKQIYSKRLNSRYSVESFTLPAVKAGSIIEYKYTVTNGMAFNWKLQSSIPVRYSRYEIDFPKDFELAISPSCSLPYQSKDLSNGNRTIKMFSMENVPPLRDEKYITNDEDYYQKIQSHVVAFTYNNMRHSFTKTWQKIAEQMILDESLGVQLKKEIPRTADLDAELAVVKDNYTKMVVIHNYVRKNMQWDGYNSIWAISGVKSAWKEGKGTAGEVNLILVNLLKDAGLKAYPVLVSTRDNGMLAPSFPSYDAFNKVLAYVELNDKIYVLDGTDKYTPSCLIPEDVMCTEGFILDETLQNKFRWTQFWDSTRNDKNLVITQARIDESGKMTGKATIRSYDYARVKRVPHIKKETQEYMRRFYASYSDELKVDSLTFNNQSVDTLPLEQAFNFQLPVNQSGEYSYFSANLFTGLKSNPFIADNRYSDVFFGTNQSFTIIGNFIIPQNYALEELPKNIRFSLEDKSLTITRMMASSGNIVNTKITIECKRPYYSPAEYADLKEFYKKMIDLLDEQIVIKKKSA